MTTTEPSVTVRMSDAWPWLLRIAGPVVGAGVGAVAAPVVRWLLDRFDAAPGPLRVLAGLPTIWAVVVCAVLGLVGGAWLASVARRESLSVTVGAASVTLDADDDAVRVPRDRIGAARRDGRDLVLLDPVDGEVVRRRATDRPGCGCARRSSSTGTGGTPRRTATTGSAAGSTATRSSAPTSTICCAAAPGRCPTSGVAPRRSCGTGCGSAASWSGTATRRRSSGASPRPDRRMAA